MADYKETNALGKAWTRAFRLVIENPMGQLGSIRFFEEQVVVIGDTTTKQESGFCSADFNPEATIQLRNPLTGEMTGAYIPQALLYQVLFSLYMDAAEARDTLAGLALAAAEMEVIVAPEQVVIEP